LTELGVSVRRRTADSPTISPAKPPALLITTPESFDALLARMPKLFIDVRAVVLDEIHLIDGTARGDQVRVLLHRLRALRRAAYENRDSLSAELQTIALSATVAQPLEVARRYCLGPMVIKVEGKRAMDAELLPMQLPRDLQNAIATFRQRGVRKALVFCASRAECARLAAAVGRATTGAGGFTNPFGDSVFVHHSSLSRNERLDVEARFSQGQVGICFATSTLELGIDIGDIDLVILIGPPYSIGSFLQRIGRGNRRTNRTSLLGFYRSPRELRLFELLLQAAETGLQDDWLYSFRPSVIVQQALSYLKQNPDGVLRTRSLRMLLDDAATQKPLLDARSEGTLIEHLVAENILRQAAHGELTAGDRAREIYTIYGENSNIESAGRGIAVVDDFTGRVIGEIQDGTLRPRDSFALGAKSLDVVRNEGHKVVVNLNDASEPERKLRFVSRAQSLPFDLARRLGEVAGIARHEMPIFEFTGRWYLVHALGDLYGRILAALAVQEFGWKSLPKPMALIAEDKPPEYVFVADEKMVSDLVRRKYKTLERLIGLGKFQAYLPDDLRRQAVESAFMVSRFCEAIKGRRIVLVEGAAQIERLREII
jgi:ATP-dependent Lhr-like helicase